MFCGLCGQLHNSKEVVRLLEVVQMPRITRRLSDQKMHARAELYTSLTKQLVATCCHKEESVRNVEALFRGNSSEVEKANTDVLRTRTICFMA